MKRVQLVELEDCEWLPRSVRDGGTDFLNDFFARIGFYKGVVPVVATYLQDQLQAEKVLDLASGGGGGSLELLGQMRADGSQAEFLFSDRFPNRAGIDRVRQLADPFCSYMEEPVDALDGGGDLPGVRTMSGALHHFPPEAVAKILQAMIRRGEAFAFLDVVASPVQRRLPWPLVIPILVINMTMLFLITWALTPWIRPFRWSRLALTYLLPAIPVMIAWDGAVSALRAYRPDELLEIARSLSGSETYDFSAGSSGQALYFTGRPIKQEALPRPA